MKFEKKLFIQQFLKIAFALLITVLLLRVYEYVAIASRLFVEHALKFELAGLFYDVWLWLQYCFVLLILFFLFWWISKRLAEVVFHTINVLFLICYIALLITFSERATPFGHEFFTRSGADSWLTIKQTMTSGIKVFFPLIIYIPFYFLVYFFITRKIFFSKAIQIVTGSLILLAIILMKNSNPSASWFNQTSAYYLTSNKMTYWLHDSYDYFADNKRNTLSAEQLQEEIKFYQTNHPFNYTSTEYPLLHKNNSADVLGSFFNLKKDSLPNIVILVVEGLSKDFTGNNAYAGSFTPFLDSLSNHSLVWDNFLSTAPGTFASQPAITASVPYGHKGFSIMNVMPDHLSLIKILKRNGYYTNFMTGFNLDFDNMGGYVRLQGTDFVLTDYEAKYKKMGVGDEGWSMGYPDDALYSRSFEVLDSIHKKPYLSIYHTATTHIPFLFAQSAEYEKKFDEKLKTMKVSPSIKKILEETKDVLVTFMFSDDCIKKFFAEYAKLPEYSNTIFFITGDHHIGDFPSTCRLDEYHIPFIVYSPMLKKPQRFYSVSSHNNITPTILGMLQHNYKLKWQPENVSWLGDVVDTATQFRNVQSMAFMDWDRDIKDYLYKNYFLSGDQLYKITPTLLLEKYQNDSLKQWMKRLLENFKNINYYVCDSNKVYPAKESAITGKKELLWQFEDSATKPYYRNKQDTSIAPYFAIPKNYKYLYIEATAEINLPKAAIDSPPTIRFALIDTKKGKQFLVWSKHDLTVLTKSDFVPLQWNSISTNDEFPLDDYKKIQDLKFEVALYTDFLPINIRMRKFKIRLYGIKDNLP